MLKVRQLIGTHDVLFMTFDTLRYDVAHNCLEEGRTPFLKSILPGQRWENRHSPGTFTFAAHQAFFAGFLPTPVAPGPHPRLFAGRFFGSETTNENTFVYDAPTWIEGLKQVGYHTICIGGVGFFNQRTALGRVLPDLFDEAHWSEDMGVTSPTSTQSQVSLAIDRLSQHSAEQRIVLFINISAIHQPNRFYLPGASVDDLRSHGAALEYVDRSLPPLFEALRSRGPSLCLLCSDHGTAYGEDGYQGHRLAHPVVWEVPYAEFVADSTPKGTP